MSKGSPIVIINMGPSINNIGNLKGGRSQKLVKLPMDSTKKLPTKGREVSKIWKKLPASFMDGPHVHNLVNP